MQKQKEEEEVKRLQREKAEAEDSGEFVEIDVADFPVPVAIVNERLRLFKEGEKQNKEEQQVSVYISFILV